MRASIAFFLGVVATAAVSHSRRDVSPPRIPGTRQIIANGGFTNGTSGWQSQPSINVGDGRLCVSVPANTPPGNISYLKTAYDFLETKNDVYTLNFTASSSVPYNISVRTPDLRLDPNLDATATLTPKESFFSFTISPANQAPNATLEFGLGGNPATAQVCFGDISMGRIDRSSYVKDFGPAIKVNQLGYSIKGPKRATSVTNATMSSNWTLVDTTGGAAASGLTLPKRRDAASGLSVQIVDFSSDTSSGRGYTLRINNASSFRFEISSTLYHDLFRDSLRWFYQQRSGIAIERLLMGEQYARAAGHVQVPPNKGDVVVPCQSTPDSLIAYLDSWTCNYTLDVTQGWYNAGDHGKYVVNGGIATARLLMAYERTAHYAGTTALASDGTLLIPDCNNGIPNILDEARWELEFMMKMQVPAGSAPQLVNGSMLDLSGMAHHRIHDNQWTPLPTNSAHDPKKRELHRPSTAATLKPRCCCGYGPFDGAFADRCMNAATTAYQAAQRHPHILAPGTDWDLSGGAYSDESVDDEFYWAAAGVYLTTGDSIYQEDLSSNMYRSANVSTLFSIPSDFSWGAVASVGQLDLASVPSNMTDHQSIVDSVAQAADMYLEVQRNKSHGFGVLLASYSWGSNSNHLNSIQILATAYDITRNETYRLAALGALDYILGRNAIAKSYVRGYGSKDPQNVHSRLYAHELDSSVPRAPMGSLARGANQDASDPPADNVLRGCEPQTCYVDDVNSYSTNEVAINWNSALAWATAWTASL